MLSDNHHSIHNYYVAGNERLKDIGEDIQQQITQLYLVGRYENLEAITSLNFSFYQINQLEHLSIGSFALCICMNLFIQGTYKQYSTMHFNILLTIVIVIS